MRVSAGYAPSNHAIMETMLGGWNLLVKKAFQSLGYGFPDTFFRGRSLDIGCGTGFLTAALQDGRIDAYGIDPDRDATEYGIKHYKPRNPRNLIVGSMASLPFKDETFYTVTTCNLSDVVNGNIGTRIPFPKEEKPNASRELYRVLERGGLYMAFDEDIPFDLPEDMTLIYENHPRWTVFRIWQKRL